MSCFCLYFPTGWLQSWLMFACLAQAGSIEVPGAGRAVGSAGVLGPVTALSLLSAQLP